jgi:3-hydroxyacyl-CoA dehydrogenase
LSNFIVRKAAVLGAGVMGAQIAAHLANADVPVVLFDLPAKEGDPSGIVRKAIDALRKLEPSPLASKDRVAYIDAANYSQHLDQLRDCDLVIEAIAERLDWKHGLYAKVAPHLRADAIFASNTSGLSINALAEGMPGQPAQPLLWHSLLQSAALHDAGRADSVEVDRCRRSRSA